MRIDSTTRTMALTAVVVVLTQSSAFCTGLNVYTDRQLWRAAAGGGSGDLAEDFNSFVEDADYGNVVVQAGFLTFSSPLGDASSFHLIDTGVFGLPSVDGSNFATLRAAEVSILGQTPMAIFDTRVAFEPVSAIGFDYRNGLNFGLPGDMLITTSLGDNLILPDTATTRFFGIVYNDDTKIDSLSFNADEANLTYSSDNWEAYTTIVPEPPAALLAFAGLLAIAMVSRRVNHSTTA